MARIAIVDDNPGVLKLLGLAVERAGHHTICILGGEPAFPLLRQMRPDLLVLDVEMPYVDGLQVLATLRHDADLRELPVIMFSACTDPEILARARHLEANGYITKGKGIEDLLACLSRHLPPHLAIGPFCP